MLEKAPPVGFIECISPSDYRIRSDTAPGAWVNVNNSPQEGWICDCMWFTLHERRQPPHPECKHIKQIKKTFIKS